MKKNKLISFLLFLTYSSIVLFIFNIDFFKFSFIKNIETNIIKLSTAAFFLLITLLFIPLIRKVLPYNRESNSFYKDDEENKSVIVEPDEINELVVNENIVKKDNLVNFEDIINTVDTFILLIDLDLKPLYINESGKNILGELFNEDDIDISSFFEDNFISQLEAIKNDNNKSSFKLETRVRVSGKKDITVSVAISKLFDEFGVFFGMVLALNNISKLKKAELNLNNQINFSKQIFKTIPEIILITDMNLRVIFANKKAEFILAKSKDENRKITNYLSQESLANGFDEYIRQTILKGVNDKRINVQNPFLSDNSFVDIEIVPLKGNEKTIGGLLLIRDITEWRNLTEELKKLENFNRKMINSSPYVIISINEDDIVSRWNDRGEELFGIKEDDIIGKNLFEVFHSVNIIRDEINEAKIIGEPIFISNKKMKIENKQNLSVEITLYPVYSSEKNVVINIRDISELKKLENSLMHAKQMGSLGLLTSKIVHDLNNVLSGITGYTTILEKKIDRDSDIRKYVDRLNISSLRAIEIIKQTLSFSKSSKHNDTKEMINVNEIITESVKLVKAGNSNMEVSLELSKKQLFIFGNKTRFSQVLVNLLVNANDAVMKVDNPIIKIKTFLKEQENEDIIVIKVIDNGSGIKPEDIKMIFDEYFTTKSESKGTGLGLSNVKDIITELDGNINVKSEYGKGTEFIIDLPLVKKTPVQENIKEKNENIEEFKNIKGKVLLVDDEEIVREIGIELLASIGFECIVAIDGEDGIRKFKENIDEIILVILDVEMPKKHGNEVFELIKKIKPNTKILISSGYAKEYLEKNIFGKKIPEYLAKPFQIEELKKKLREIIG